jgi:predicted GIY-YIG superfamily endonuclease
MDIMILPKLYSINMVATIYKLSHTDGYFVIGSTNNYAARMKNHKRELNTGNSDFQTYARSHGGWDTVTCTILKQWDCSDLNEMFQEEGRHIDEVYKDPYCLNMKRSGLTLKSGIGIVYKLTIANTWTYYGSTRDLYQRQAAHKSSSVAKDTLLYRTIREHGGWGAVTCEIVRQWECSTSDLKACEDEYIRKEWDAKTLLNSTFSSTTPELMKKLSNARVQKWVDAHPDEAKEQSRIRAARWRENNPDKAKDVQKRFRDKQKTDPIKSQQINDYNKEYYEKNREELNRKKREKRALAKEQSMLA